MDIRWTPFRPPPTRSSPSSKLPSERDGRAIRGSVEGTKIVSHTKRLKGRTLLGRFRIYDSVENYTDLRPGIPVLIFLVLYYLSLSMGTARGPCPRSAYSAPIRQLPKMAHARVLQTCRIQVANICAPEEKVGRGASRPKYLVTWSCRGPQSRHDDLL